MNICGMRMIYYAFKLWKGERKMYFSHTFNMRWEFCYLSSAYLVLLNRNAPVYEFMCENVRNFHRFALKWRQSSRNSEEYKAKMRSDGRKAHSPHRWSFADHPIRCKTTDRFPPTTNHKPLIALQTSAAHRQTDHWQESYHQPYRSSRICHSLLFTTTLDNCKTKTNRETFLPSWQLGVAGKVSPSPNNGHEKSTMICVRCALPGVYGGYGRNLSFFYRMLDPRLSS